MEEDRKDKVAILSINIGDYDVFWEEFYKSSEKNFLPEYKKEYYVFSNKKALFGEGKDNVEIIFQEDLGWPFNTLKRFHMFYEIKNQIACYKYVFFANANAKFVFPLYEGFMNKQKNLVVVEHPGYHLAKDNKKPFETRKTSRAYVDEEKRKIYVQGAFYGGKANYFNEMVCELKYRTEQDLNKNIIAIWHDESFLNSYVAGRSDVQILGWQYLYYEEYILPYEPVIILRNKRKYITNKNGRFLGENYALKDIKLFIRNMKWRLLIIFGIYKRYKVYEENSKRYIDKDIETH